MHHHANPTILSISGSIRQDTKASIAEPLRKNDLCLRTFLRAIRSQAHRK